MTEQKFFADLNPQQVEAVKCLDGPLLVMAGAGSGKTRVLTYRIANLIACGVSPWNILAITFTNKAANEMKSRAAKLIGDEAQYVWLSTFHSFCARLLRREIAITNVFTSNFAIYDAADSKTLIKMCADELKLNADKVPLFQKKISDAKNDLIDAKHFSERALSDGRPFFKNIAQVYELYQKKLRESNALDFDDLIFTAVEIFRKNPDVLERYQRRFQYILIDEYQDTNEAQYVLTKLLADAHQNICVVGDADQSIYGWRGANMRNILNFKRDYPDATVVKLEQNYRSTKNILDAANAVIANNREREEKNLWTLNERGTKVKFVECPSDQFEAAAIASEIRRLVNEENFLYNDIALLYRTNSQSRSFEDRFMRMEIPYVIIGGLRFYERKEIKDILAYLHVVANPRDNIHLMRIVNVPRRGIGPTSFGRLREFADAHGLSVLDVVNNAELLRQVRGPGPAFRQRIQDFAAMIMSFAEMSKTLPIDKLIEQVLHKSGYLQMLKDMPEENELKDSSRIENLGEFLSAAKEFVNSNADATLEDFLNHVALISSTEVDTDDKSVVRLMTIHAAKGLEFPVVFVTGMEENLFPHKIALESHAELEEERRACYVALTRAKKKLYLTAADTRMLFGKERAQEVSRFVDEIPSEFVERLSAFGTPRRRPVTQSYTQPQPVRPSVKPKTVNAPPITWHVGDTVNHKKWGLGTVMALDARTITISFANPEVGVRVLAIKVAPIVRG